MARRRWSRLGLGGNAVQWVVLGILAVVAAVLGYVGSARHYAALGWPADVSDLVYADLALFAWSGQFGPSPLPASLDLARFLAPAVTAFSAFRALGALFRDRLDVVRAAVLRGHVVVVGAGDKGAAVATGLRAAGTRVVVLDADPAARHLPTVRSTGAVFLAGDGRDRASLTGASVQRARVVIVLAGDDGVNAEVAMAVGRIAEAVHRTITCLVHVDDADLCRLLRLREVQRAGVGGLLLDFLNVDELVARRLSAAVADDDVVRLDTVGSLGDRLGMDLARGRPEGHRPRILAQTEGATDDVGDVTVAVVFRENDAATLQVVLDLRHRLLREARIVGVFRRSDGLSELAGRRTGRPRVEVVALDAALTEPGTLRPWTVEVLAEAIHEAYRATRHGEGGDDQDDPSLDPWSELGAALRSSNRDQARAMMDRIAWLGAVVVPMSPEPHPPFELAPSEVEELARREHRRWVVERRAAGWRFGPRDPTVRRSPHLVPWEELDEDVRDLDRGAIRAMPRVLAAAGLRPVRIEPPTEGPLDGVAGHSG